MSDSDNTIDWSKTTFAGSRREQLRRWAALSLRKRLEALDRLSEQAQQLANKAASEAAASGVQEEPASYRTARSRNEIVLHGCAPTPLAAYLKALAVLRLVAEQAGDPNVTGCWRKDAFVLQTRLSRDELIEFFLQRYEPTPLVAPWGARSGFYSGSSEKTAREALDQIARSVTPRLQKFKAAIIATRALLGQFGFDEKASDERKLELLSLCRTYLPDHLLPWLDACYVLTEDGRKFPPLLGTGGNEGSGSYVSGFAQQVVACIIERRYDDALKAAIFGAPTFSATSGQTPGHFSPIDAGGANMSSGFEGGTQTNAWDYLLALEGTLLFASTATRRNESSSPSFNFPFVVSPLSSGASGYVQQEERPKKAKRQVMEIWLPLWYSPCCLDELNALFSEGRATLKRRAAANSLDFARAVAMLGADRGIAQFQRYSFLMRNGQSFFATPLEKLRVCRNVRADLIDELDHCEWLARLQRYARDDRAPSAFRALTAQLDAALFALTQRAERQSVERVLRLLGRIEAKGAVSPSMREAIGPVPRLSPRWASEADDGSTEFRISLALAGLSMRSEDDSKPVMMGLRPHLAPLSRNERVWDTESLLMCWGPGSIERNLATLLHRRRIEAIRIGVEGELLHGRAGAALDDIRRFLSTETDDRRIAELMHGLACVNLDGWRSQFGGQPEAMPAAYSLLKPFFTAESLLKAIGWLPPDRSLRLPAEIPPRLAADDVNAALRIAWQRLRAIGCKLPGRHPPQVTHAGDGPRLLAALTIPLTWTETRYLLRWLALAPEHDEAPDRESFAETTD
jgi:CRISPR-associated protein Csx17